MHFEKQNLEYEYIMTKDNTTNKLDVSNVERDNGMIFSNDLKVSQHISVVVSKANRVLGLILNTFEYLDLNTFRILYCTFVRPLLDYAVVVWNPYLYLSKDVATLELIQRRATKRAPGLRNLSYEQRLNKLNLTTLEERRVRGDLIQQYKNDKGIDIINW